MKRRRLPLVLLSSLALTIYFAHHALNGSHGFQARLKLTERASMLERDVARLEAVRAKLKRDVALLAPEQPDPDMIAQIAADILGYVAADALIVAPSRK